MISMYHKTGSDFVPYITTIGLYNAAGQLLVIGKLGQPIKNRDDVDMNFLISIDIDKNKPAKITIDEEPIANTPAQVGYQSAILGTTAAPLSR